MHKKIINNLTEIISISLVHQKKAIESGLGADDFVEIAKLTPGQEEVDFVVEHDEITKTFVVATVALIVGMLSDCYTELRNQNTHKPN